MEIDLNTYLVINRDDVTKIISELNKFYISPCDQKQMSTGQARELYQIVENIFESFRINPSNPLRISINPLLRQANAPMDCVICALPLATHSGAQIQDCLNRLECSAVAFRS